MTVTVGPTSHIPPESVRRDEITPIPHPLGYSIEQPLDYLNVPGMDADVNIGGILFLSMASEDDPYQRQLQKVQKDRLWLRLQIRL